MGCVDSLVVIREQYVFCVRMCVYVHASELWGCSNVGERWKHFRKGSCDDARSRALAYELTVVTRKSMRNGKVKTHGTVRDSVGAYSKPRVKVKIIGAEWLMHKGRAAPARSLFLLA